MSGTPLSILHLIAPAPLGGLESVVHALAAGHQTRGHRVAVGAVLTPTAEVPVFLKDLSLYGVRVEAMRVSARGYLHEIRLIEALCRDLSPDVVHTHGYRSDLVAGWAARRAGLPVVTTMHGFTVAGWKNQLYQWLQRRMARRMRAVVAVSQPIADRLIAGGTSGTRVVVLPNALAAGYRPLDRAAAARALGLADRRFRLGWIGRITADKGLDVFIRALQHMPAEAWSASIVGDGPGANEARRIVAALGLEDRVTWHGAVVGAGTMMRAFDVFVLSSRTEGTPIVLLEAMAAGVPIVATRVGGVPDVISETEALLVPAEDPPAIARALRLVMADPSRSATRAQAALDRVSHYGSEAWLSRYEAVYAAVLDGSPLPAHC